jgi:hypothetical protein
MATEIKLTVEEMYAACRGNVYEIFIYIAVNKDTGDKYIRFDNQYTCYATSEIFKYDDFNPKIFKLIDIIKTKGCSSIVEKNGHMIVDGPILLCDGNFSIKQMCNYGKIEDYTPEVFTIMESIILTKDMHIIHEEYIDSIIEDHST